MRDVGEETDDSLATFPLFLSSSVLVLSAPHGMLLFRLLSPFFCFQSVSKRSQVKSDSESQGVQILLSSLRYDCSSISLSSLFHSLSTFHQLILHSLSHSDQPKTHALIDTPIQRNMPAVLKHDSNMATTTTTTPVPTITCTKEENILHQAWHSLEEALHLREPVPPPGNIQLLLPQNKVFAN